MPMDVEWAGTTARSRSCRRVRSPASRAQVEEWNDSLRGEYLWTAGNFGEAIPDVMTPDHVVVRAAVHPRGDVGVGLARLRHGGQHRWPLLHEPHPRLRDGRRLRGEELVQRAEKASSARSRRAWRCRRRRSSDWAILRQAVPTAIGIRLRARKYLKGMRAFLAASPRRCEELRARIAADHDGGRAGRPVRDARSSRTSSRPCRMLEAAGRQGGTSLVKTRDQLRKMVGDVDAEAMLTGAAADGELASLGLIIGLSKLARGEITRADVRPRRTGTAARTSSSCRPRGPAKIPTGSTPSSRVCATCTPTRPRCSRARSGPGRRRGRGSPRATRARRRPCASGCGGGAASCATGRRPARRASGRSGCCARSSCGPGELTGRGDDVFFLDRHELLDLLRGEAGPAGAGAGAAGDLRAVPGAAAVPGADRRPLRPGPLGRRPAAAQRPLRRAAATRARERHRHRVPRRRRRGRGHRAGDRRVPSRASGSSRARSW